MNLYHLNFTLKSDANFGSGDSVAGLIDSDIQHDEFGLPYVAGRTLRGLLNEECANILYALDLQNKKSDWLEAAHHLFGAPGSTTKNTAALHIGNASLINNLRMSIIKAVEDEEAKPQTKLNEILAALTTVRRQTAIDEKTGAALDTSLRSIRVILRQTPFVADLYFNIPPTDKDLALLAACVKAWRYGGLARNRGLGHLQATIHTPENEDMTEPWFQKFKELINVQPHP